MTRPTDEQVWAGFERRAAAVERMLPGSVPSWRVPDGITEGSVASRREPIHAASRPGRSLRDAAPLMALVAIVAVVVALVRLAPPAVGPAAVPSPSASAVPSASASAGVQSPSASASSIVPQPSLRHLSDIVFGQSPAWLVPADSTTGPGGSGDDGTWSLGFDVPRAPDVVRQEYLAALASHTIEVTEFGTLPDGLILRSRGVNPSIAIYIAGSAGGSQVSVLFDNRATK
ncbi:MAG: hypothetical protein QOE42_1613 [Chloroflexota bacterium]|jgi:hypothetical protein|nr:hypothetical protein [Chloroflexota bacterium]